MEWTERQDGEWVGKHDGHPIAHVRKSPHDDKWGYSYRGGTFYTGYKSADAAKRGAEEHDDDDRRYRVL